MTQQLLDAGADLNNNGDDCLLEAAQLHYWKIAELLVERGAKSQGLSAFFATNHAERIDLPSLQFLKKHGADPNYIRQDPEVHVVDLAIKIPLHYAVSRKNHDYLIKLLKLGANANLATKPSNIQALHIAAALGDKKSMSLLIEAGADKDARTIAADQNSQVDFRNIILNNTSKAAIDLVPIKQVSFLLKKGARPTSDSLVRAINEKEFELVKLILENGADPNQARGKSGDLLNLALRKNHDAIADLLIEYGAHISSANWQYLDLPKRLKFARSDLYPKLSSATVAHVSFPEVDHPEQAIKTHELSASPAQSFRSIRIPSRSVTYYDQQPVNPDQLIWTLIRRGAERIVKPQEKIPSLEPGDVLEVTGFQKLVLRGI